ncbi:MAG TPA: acetylornithine deacetylase, partial [Stellaceae bacterium]|nr:acetylornithine deacetylase [Stellaceae bacterium]
MPQPALSSVEMVRRLVAFDTTSRGSNLALIDFVRDHLARCGLASELVFDETGKKANLYAKLGPPEAGGIMLSGHTDVVPVDGQDWHSDPFSVLAKDGRLYGRGTADMKSFLAVILAVLPELVERPLRIPIHLAFSYDEEVGCRGVRRLISAIADRPDRPLLCIVGEPTEMRPVIGHKGKRSFRCHVHGFECHSALTHEGVNAVEAAAELVAHLKRMARRKREEGPFESDYAPPYTTIHTGIIRGGTALNIIPKECSFDFEFRLLPRDDPDVALRELVAFAEERVLPEMRAVRPETGISFEEISSFPGLDTAADAEVTRLVAALCGANGTGKV